VAPGLLFFRDHKKGAFIGEDKKGAFIGEGASIAEEGANNGKNTVFFPND